MTQGWVNDAIILILGWTKEVSGGTKEVSICNKFLAYIRVSSVRTPHLSAGAIQLC